MSEPDARPEAAGAQEAATGGYETQAAITFTEASLPFAIVFPRRVRQLALGLGIIAKTDEIDETDEIDAKVIACYGRLAEIETSRIERAT